MICSAPRLLNFLKNIQELTGSYLVGILPPRELPSIARSELKCVRPIALHTGILRANVWGGVVRLRAVKR